MAVRSLVGEFKSFLLKHNALALAVGVVIGASVGKVVTGFVDDLIMPIVNVIVPGGEWREWVIPLRGSAAIKIGDLLGRILDFMIVAAVVFAIIKLFVKDLMAATRPCPECTEQIPFAAKRCRFCTAVSSA